MARIYKVLTKRSWSMSFIMLGLLALGYAFSHTIFSLYEEPAIAQTNSPPGASVSVKVQVPASMRTSPFNVDRYLNIPPGFSISVYARVSGARFMAIAPNGDLLVSRPGAGKVVIVRPTASGDPSISDFATGLRNPHDVVFHTIGTTTYVYIAESHQINRYLYNFGDTSAHNRQVVVANLPDASSPELNGAYGHQLKNIALDSNHKLYVSIASATNASVSDAKSDPVRCAVYQYNADGTGRRLFARGLRNAEGLAFVPGTTTLWVAVNNRDNIKYPFHNDWNGDGTDDYGKVMASYVDNHPPDEFTSVRDGANYGWPYANPNPDTANGMDNMPFDFDVDNNPNWSVFPESTFTRIDKGIQAHSAPLGISFLQDTKFPAAYRNGAVLGLHGSWNRQKKTGYKVIYYPWNTTTQKPGQEIDLVTGWLNDSTQNVWGRPVDAIADLQGNLLISDDHSGTVYKLIPNVTNETFTIPLSKNWNLISLPIQPDNTNIENVLSSVNGLYTAVHAWNGTAYESYYAEASSNTLSQMVTGRGYWIYMKENANLSISGRAAPTNVAIKQNWNLVGYNSKTPVPVSEATASLGDKITVVYGYNPSTNSYEEAQTFQPGKGYWMLSTSDATWRLP
jgi:glucose/arabinose dehydrogenase